MSRRSKPRVVVDNDGRTWLVWKRKVRLLPGEWTAAPRGESEVEELVPSAECLLLRFTEDGVEEMR